MHQISSAVWRRLALDINFSSKRCVHVYNKGTVSSWRQLPISSRSLHAGPPLYFPRRRDFFSSNAILKQENSQQHSEGNNGHQGERVESQKQKPSRPSVTKSSLRRVAAAAQRSKVGKLSQARPTQDGHTRTKVCFLLRIYLPQD